MQWAKTQPAARCNLAGSGLRHYPLAELGVRIEDLEISGPSFYGYPPLQEALAAKCGVPRECVMAAIGTSMANHLAMAVVLQPGEEVLIEHPAYEPMLAAARYLGADVKRFERPAERGFAIDLEVLARAVTPRTRLIVLTNLHNPSSALSSSEELRSIGEVARGVGARVLVDEVYLDAAGDPPPPTSFLLGDHFLVTSSLTKVYGLSGLRCGWALARPDLVERMWRLNDLFGVIPAHPAELLSVMALKNLERVAAWARELLARNRALLNSFLASCPQLEAPALVHGTVCFPRLRRGNADHFCATLREKYEVLVVPGRFFEAAQHFRIGIGGDTSALAEGLERISTALRTCG
jgi:aspartate/methionine/tyrosine aminotransferase